MTALGYTHSSLLLRGEFAHHGCQLALWSASGVAEGRGGGLQIALPRSVFWSSSLLVPEAGGWRPGHPAGRPGPERTWQWAHPELAMHTTAGARGCQSTLVSTGPELSVRTPILSALDISSVFWDVWIPRALCVSIPSCVSRTSDPLPAVVTNPRML